MKLIKITFNKNERFLIVLMVLSTAVAFNTLWFSKKKSELLKLNSTLQVSKSKLLSKQRIIKISEIKVPKKPDKKNRDFNYNDYLNNSFTNIIKQFDSNLSTKEIKINHVIIVKNKKIGELNRRLFEIELEAPYIQVGKFIEHLEKQKLLINIKSVEVNRLPDDLRLCKTIIKVYSFSPILSGGKKNEKNI